MDKKSAIIDNLMASLPNEEALKQLPADGGEKWNRLVFEKSPYLLQHADNPVDWYPWGEEAFNKAKQEDKSIFLSIGYSTCHWCHVMAHESFEDRTVADILNKHFVCIKVDREDRPDIDSAYMAVTQAITGRGGWPMSVFMTAAKKPFFAGTYFPKHRNWNMPGFMEVITSLYDAWTNRRDEVNSSAEKIYDLFNNPAKLVGKERDDSVKDILAKEYNFSTEEIKPLMDEAYKSYLDRFDKVNGGFGQAPKFPSAHNLIFLLEYYERNNDSQALKIVEQTLTNMWHGGLYDQLGYGFHRYSTDDKWLVPHFEKMLYDQAMLMMAYAKAYEITKKAVYKQVIEELYEYLIRDMSSTEGAFYSAEDADSEGEEGKFYTWSNDELVALINSEFGEKAQKAFWANRFIEIYNCKAEGNFHEEASHELTGTNILHLKEPLDKALARVNDKVGDKALGIDELKQINAKLYELRKDRVPPLKDDKILTDWNGLMATALIRAAKAISEDQAIYLAAAKKSIDFILTKLKDPQTGKLNKRYRNGQLVNNACLNDYAFMIWALIELYELDSNSEYLSEASRLNKLMIEEFWDEEKHGFFLASKLDFELPIHSKEIYDGATPSGNSVAAFNLIKLAKLDQVNAAEHYQVTQKLISHFWDSISSIPAGHAHMLCALYMILDYQQPMCTEEGCSL